MRDLVRGKRINPRSDHILENDVVERGRERLRHGGLVAGCLWAWTSDIRASAKYKPQAEPAECGLPPSAGLQHANEKLTDAGPGSPPQVGT